MKRFTLTECYELLNVDPKTFRSWLAKDNIQATPSKADPRVKYLTEEQVEYLAKEHERLLKPNPTSTEIIPPNAYKLLVDQADKVEGQVGNLVAEQQAVREELAEQEVRVTQAIATLNGTLGGQITEIQGMVDAHYQQHETVAMLVTQMQQRLEQLQNTLTEQLTEVQQTVETQHRQHESLAVLTSENQQQVEQLRGLVVQNDQQVRQRIQEVSTSFTERYQKMEQAIRDLRTQTTEQAKAMQRQRTEIERVFGEQLRSIATGLQQVERDVAVDAAATNERLETIERKQESLLVQIEAAKIIGLGAQQRVDGQNERIEALQRQLQELQQAPKKASGGARKKAEVQDE